MDRFALEGEVEGLAFGSDDGGGANADERFDWNGWDFARLDQVNKFYRRRPMVDVPPVLELARAGEVGADDHNRPPIVCASYGIGKGDGQGFRSERGFDFADGVAGQGRGISIVVLVPGDDNYIRAVIAELGAEFGLDIHIKIHHRG